MKTMKKLLAAVLATVMLLGVTACGNKNDTPAADGDTTGTTGGTGGAEDTGIDEGTVSVDDLPDSADSQTGAQDSAAVPQQSAGLTWLWVLLGVIAVAAIIGIVVTRKKKH